MIRKKIVLLVGIISCMQPLLQAGDPLSSLISEALPIIRKGSQDKSYFVRQAALEKDWVTVSFLIDLVGVNVALLTPEQDQQLVAYRKESVDERSYLLLQGIWEKDSNKVRLALSDGLPAHSVYALCVAAVRNNSEAVTLLIAAGVSATSLHNAPLQLAFYREHWDLVFLLLDLGASLDSLFEPAICLLLQSITQEQWGRFLAAGNCKPYANELVMHLWHKVITGASLDNLHLALLHNPRPVALDRSSWGTEQQQPYCRVQVTYTQSVLDEPLLLHNRRADSPASSIDAASSDKTGQLSDSDEDRELQDILSAIQ
ncbi:ankyrin repeat domain-containing protein [Candidatus Dependentiae bacterium]|nr:ankyrin repeat domain-containing protein [Candidatus Dependentiae bacterium]